MTMQAEFTAHNIRLDDGTLTIPKNRNWSMDTNPWFLSAKRILDLAFPGDKRGLRIADLGCLEGGFTVEFARMGFQSLGIDIRESNIAACRYVEKHTNLPNLRFVQDDAWNVAQYGPFDAVFCCGLYYHIDRPKQFLGLLSEVTTKVLILQTHFSTENPNPTYRLSELCQNEGIEGRWFTEFGTPSDFTNREQLKWAAWDNRRSFWVRREYLLQAIRDVGFNTVLEQFDGIGYPAGDIVASMTKGWYKVHERGTFVGIKSEE
jgi:SAM-dependent methyltransferase